MVFTDIRLQNYRSYIDESFEFSDGVNIIVGPNAVGKTNLLEAIMMSSVGRSFRVKDKFLINSKSDWSRIDVHTSDNQTRVVKIQNNNQTTEKTFLFEQKSYKTITEKYTHPVVLFEPDDLLLLYNEPNLRRDYLDNLIEQYNPKYSHIRKTYARVLAQRNALLKTNNFSKSQLFAWDIRLCDVGSEIIKQRLQLVDEINKKISKTYSSIAQKKTRIDLSYYSKTNTSNYSNQLLADLNSSLEIDKIRGFTSRGPHRDDFMVNLNNIPANLLFSRGENRTFILSLKIIELEILFEKTNKKPILLLDDVFSELDGSRRKSLTKYLQTHQTLITTTDADIILKNFTNKTHIILMQ